MQHNIIEVTPYDPSYRVFSVSTSKIIAEFDTLSDAVEFFSRRQPPRCPDNFYNLLRLYGHRLQADVGPRPIGPKRVLPEGWKSPIHTPPQEKWILCDDLGDEVPTEAFREAQWRNRHRRKRVNREQRYAKYDLHRFNLRGIKGSLRRIKTNCQTFLGTSYSNELCYDNPIRGYHRYPKTQRERRILGGIIDDYGWSMVRGKRRNLPSNWDDRSCSLNKTETSWKHNSKRKKQWIPK